MFPRPKYEGSNYASIVLYNLNIARDPQSLNLRNVEEEIPNKHRAHFLIVFEERLKKGQWLNLIFDEFWKKKILNVLVVFWSTDCKLNIISHTPFKIPRLINYNENVTAPDILFADKTKNLYGHKLRISLFYENGTAMFQTINKTRTAILSSFSGSDGFFARFVIEEMNAAPIIVTPTDGHEIGELLPNGSYTGCFGHLVKKEADVGLNVRFFRMDQFKNYVEASHSNGRDDICVLVPKAGYLLTSNTKQIFRAFNKYVWIPILLAIPIFTIIFKLFHRKYFQTPEQNVDDSYYTWINTIFYFFSWNLQQPINKIPLFWITRILLSTWLIYSFLITIVYQGKIAGNLIVPTELPDINTVNQLDNSGLIIKTYKRYKDLIEKNKFYESYNTSAGFIKRIQATEQNEFFRLIDEKNTSYAYANKYHLNLNFQRKTSINGYPRFNMMQQCPIPHINIYGVTYGSPYKYRINLLLRHAQEAGLFQIWSGQKILQNIAQRKLFNGQDHTPFSLDDLQMAFYLYIGGMSMATLSYLAEYYKGSKFNI